MDWKDRLLCFSSCCFLFCLLVWTCEICSARFLVCVDKHVLVKILQLFCVSYARPCHFVCVCVKLKLLVK